MMASSSQTKLEGQKSSGGNVVSKKPDSLIRRLLHVQGAGTQPQELTETRPWHADGRTHAPSFLASGVHVDRKLTGTPHFLENSRRGAGGVSRQQRAHRRAACALRASRRVAPGATARFRSAASSAAITGWCSTWTAPACTTRRSEGRGEGGREIPRTRVQQGAYKAVERKRARVRLQEAARGGTAVPEWDRATSPCCQRRRTRP